MSDFPNYTSVKGMAEKFPDVCSKGGLRWQIFNEEINGLKQSGVIVRVGRKVLINIDRYFQWIDSQQEFRREQ